MALGGRIDFVYPLRQIAHSFRKSVGTLIDDRGFSVRIGADQLGHARPSMIQDRYMARGKLHSQVAEALDEAISAALALHEQAAPTQKGP